MTEQEQHRFDMLRHGPCAPIEYVSSYYGLSWPLLGDAHTDYAEWVGHLRRRRSCGNGRISRYELESFMQQKSVVPKKWMGLDWE